DKVKTASEDELLDILSSNGMLVKRPLLIKEDLVLIGFKEEEWAENLK
ncbi:MAG: ArsC/Spx/MgsR family protein, partial [Clostridium perfringens]